MSIIKLICKNDNFNFYRESIKDKLIVVAALSMSTEYLTHDFLFEFREFVLHRRYHLERYEFVVINTDDKPLFRYMTSYFLGIFDTPGVFAIKDAEDRIYFRNYEIYSGSNFKDLSEGFLTKINTGHKMQLHSTWL